MAKTIKKYGKITLILGLILVLLGMYLATPISQAATIANREMKISDSRPNAPATSVTYDFEGDHSGTSVQCIRIQYCTNATGACTKPTGMVTLSATKGASGDWNGWTYANWAIDNTTDGETKYTNGSGQTGGSNYSISVNSITNPTSAGTYYAKVTTYTDTGCSTPAGGQDTGTTAFAIVSGVSISANVKESLSFTLSADVTIGFGTWNTTELRYATTDELGDTNPPANDLPVKLTLTTNAGGTTTIYIKDEGSGAAAGLYKASPAYLIPAVGATTTVPTAGNEQYAAYGKNAVNFVIDEGFNADDTGAVAISRTPLPFATASGAVTATMDLALKAAIAGTTPAGAYADTVTLIATPVY